MYMHLMPILIMLRKTSKQANIILWHLSALIIGAAEFLNIQI